jgi:hypothetical protein
MRHLITCTPAARSAKPAGPVQGSRQIPAWLVFRQRVRALPAHRPWARGIAVAVGLTCLCLRAGLGAEHDLESDRAEAAAGDPKALVRLAERYETADGVPFDLSAASAFFELAAERGDAAAQYRLGLLQAGGLDPDADVAEAYGWLRLAAQNAGDAPSGLLADAISKALADRLDADTIERAEQRIAAFQPATGPAELPMVGDTRPPEDDPAALLALLPPTGCGSPEIQRSEDGDTVLLAYAPSDSMIDATITPAIRTDLASRGAALDVVELSPAICEVRDIAATAREQATGVSLADVADDARATLRDGDKLVIDIAPASEPRYVAVDYVVQTGEVWHLYPSLGDDGYLPAGQSLRLGDGSDGAAWEVGAPFGEDLVLVTLSASPLDTNLPVSEPVDTFRPRLQQRLQAGLSGDALGLFARVVAIRAR